MLVAATTDDDFILLAVSALQVIQQSTGLDLGWQDDPCSPVSWDQIGCEGNIVTSLYVHFYLLKLNWCLAFSLEMWTYCVCFS